MGWKPQYAENRRKKYQADESVREKRKSQGRSPEENAEYMRLYYEQNKGTGRFRRTPEKQKAFNESRRKRYATDPEFRRKAIEASKRRPQSERFKYRLKAEFGLTFEQYMEMLENQRGCCTICTKPSKKLVVDHCHTTGKVRSLLCNKCNLGIGIFDDDPRRMELAANYVRAHSTSAENSPSQTT